MVRRSHAAAWVDVADAIYAPTEPHEDWLREVLGRIDPLLGPSVMLYAIGYDASEPSAMKVTSFVSHHLPGGVPPEMAEAGVRAAQAALPTDDVRKIFWMPRAATASELLGRGTNRKLRLREIAGPFGIADTLGVNAVGPERVGINLVASLAAPTRVHRERRGVLVRLAAHLSAAARMRRERALRGQGVAVRPEEGAAVLDERGKLVHAEPSIGARGQRDALVDAARALVAERRTRVASDDDAMQIWRGLVDARWSLVASSDVDGRRFLVAVENEVGSPLVEPLTSLERTIAALVSIGNANRQVAYELGLSPSGVARVLASAQRKLGLRSRAELAQLVLALAPTPSPWP